jgi:hypothetical protein
MLTHQMRLLSKQRCRSFAVLSGSPSCADLPALPITTPFNVNIRQRIYLLQYLKLPFEGKQPSLSAEPPSSFLIRFRAKRPIDIQLNMEKVDIVAQPLRAEPSSPTEPAALRQPTPQPFRAGRGCMYRHSPLMRSLLSQSQTPTAPRRAVGFFRSGCSAACVDWNGHETVQRNW